MIEILGGNLESTFRGLNINAIKTYEGNTYLDDKTQVWEVKDEDFERLCNIDNDDWKNEWGWWRSANGSNICSSLDTFKIKGQEIIAWDGANRSAAEEEENEEDRWWFDKEYSNLLEYFCDEIGASQSRNVCALAVDLARINNKKLSELFQKYQG